MAQKEGIAKEVTPDQDSEIMLPPHSEMVNRENGTVARMKGEKLSVQAETSSDFQRAKTQKDFTEMVFLFIEMYKDVFKLTDPRREMVVDKVSTDSLGTTHVSLQQIAGGVPVWGRTMVIHFSGDQTIYLIQGDYVCSLVDMNTTPGITAAKASENALAAAPGGRDQWIAQDVFLYVYVTPSQIPHLVYGVTLAQGLMERELFFVDAENGDTLHRLPLTSH